MLAREAVAGWVAAALAVLAIGGLQQLGAFRIIDGLLFDQATTPRLAVAWHLLEAVGGHIHVDLEAIGHGLHHVGTDRGVFGEQNAQGRNADRLSLAGGLAG